MQPFAAQCHAYHATEATHLLQKKPVLTGHSIAKQTNKMSTPDIPPVQKHKQQMVRSFLTAKATTSIREVSAD